MKIGIVDLDTSHPQNWIPIERELGHEIVGVWDGGAVHPRSYVEKFAADHSIPTLFDSLEEMAPAVDCAIIHGCDWDTHVPKARPFVEAGKSVLIDKPMAGNREDLAQIQSWANAGARIAGGSSLRFCVETAEWLLAPLDQRGTPNTVLCGCSTDLFNYGIHAYSMLAGIMGPGAARVRYLGECVQKQVMVEWTDGRTGFLAVGAADGYLPFYASIVTEKTVHQIQADFSRLYRALLVACLPFLARETDRSPVPVESLTEPELWAVAARESWLNGDAPVELHAPASTDRGYDGAAFSVEYRRMRYPG